MKIAEIATARAGAYADMCPEGAGMVAAYDDLIDELGEELVPAELEQLRANENTLDALGRQIHQLQTQLARRRWPRDGAAPVGRHGSGPSPSRPSAW
jgi:hypothetical protein